MNKNDMKAVTADSELIESVFRPGARYYVRTPTYHYTGTLVAVTGLVFVFENVSTVFASGELQEFFKTGKGKNEEAHGKGRAIIDRAGAGLFEL